MCITKEREIGIAQLFLRMRTIKVGVAYVALPAEKMSESEEEAVVSLQEVLEETNQLEETANAVLGGSDDASCTYPNV